MRISMAKAMDALARAKDAMIEAINDALISAIILHETTNGCIQLDVYDIGANEDGEGCVFDKNGNELYHLEDLEIEELNEIIKKIMRKLE